MGSCTIPKTTPFEMYGTGCVSRDPNQHAGLSVLCELVC